MAAVETALTLRSQRGARHGGADGR
jgi:hypothetical protein